LPFFNNLKADAIDEVCDTLGRLLYQVKAVELFGDTPTSD
jgi:hypothetical protein